MTIVPLDQLSSLKDLYVLREMKKQSNPTYSAMKSLIDGFTAGLEEQREAAKLKKQKEEEFNASINQFENVKNTFGEKYDIALQNGKIAISPKKEESEGLHKLQLDIVKAGKPIPKNKEEALMALQEIGEKKSALEERKTQTQEGRLDFYKQQELRRTADNKLSGGFPLVLDTNNPNEVDNYVLEQYGLDIDTSLALGIAKKNPNGTVTLAPTKERDRVLSERTVPDEAGKFIAEAKDSKDILVSAFNEYKDLKLDLSTKEKNIAQQLLSEAGPLSISAKNSLLQQFRNPRVAALFDKLERAFQKYRIQVTGAQASDKELARLRPLIANLSQNPEVFTKNLSDIINELDQSVTNRLGILKSYNRDENVINNLDALYFKNVSPTIQNIQQSPMMSFESQQNNNVNAINQQQTDIPAQGKYTGLFY